MVFTQDACDQVEIPFKILDYPLHEDFMRNFGERRTVSIPWWTLRDDGHKAKMPRNCTIDYKIEVIAKYVRWEVLGYRKGQRLRPEDRKAHEMHMGFSYEEQKRCKESTNPMFVNHYPLVEMKLVRADNYAYIREVWAGDKGFGLHLLSVPSELFLPLSAGKPARGVRAAGHGR